jgi:hypothetical protein
LRERQIFIVLDPDAELHPELSAVRDDALAKRLAHGVVHAKCPVRRHRPSQKRLPITMTSIACGLALGRWNPGVRARLLLAFFGVSGFSILAAGAGIYAFRRSASGCR